MKFVAACILRGAVITVCAVAGEEAVRIATVDVLAATGSEEGLERALRIMPSNAVLSSQLALRHDAVETSAAARLELLKANRLNPLDSEVLIALGLGEEFRGNAGEAERYLAHAAEVDRTFRPAWTLANFYYRTNQPEKFWQMMHRCLELEPLAFDLTPLFDLCWNETGDGLKILSQLPEYGPKPGEYLRYLLSRNRLEQAVQAWPRALAAADPARGGEVETLTAFPEAMEAAGRMPEAIGSWNQLVDRKVIASGHLDPAAGMFIADPEFAFPLLERAFGWRVAHQSGVFATQGAGSLRFEFDGTEAEPAVLMQTMAPLLPAREYRLTWRADATRLSASRDPGFAFRITRRPGDSTVECAPLLRNGGEGDCRFSSLADSAGARLELIYRRALGTTRAEGTLRVNSVRLEAVS